VGVVYRRLARRLGPQQWWPARTRFEVMVGAILTQATRWHNAEVAIRGLRNAKALTPERLARLRRPTLERHLRPSGYFRQKADRLSRFVRWYRRRFQGRAQEMFRVPQDVLRQELLGLRGIGEETADAILLYAGRQPIFVVDAYTRRIFRRHRFISSRASYAQVQQLVMRALRPETRTYNEFHALLVEVGKRYCHRRNPECARCPLGDFPHTVVEKGA